MKTFFTIIFMMIVLFSSVDCNCIDNNDNYNKITQKDCISSISFFKKLAEAKVLYESAMYFKDSNDIDKCKKIYFRLLDVFYSKKGFFIDCIYYFLDNETDFCKNHLIDFSFYPGWNNTIPKCGLMTYENFLRTLLYNLEKMSDNNKDLKCEESVFKDLGMDNS